MRWGGVLVVLVAAMAWAASASASPAVFHPPWVKGQVNGNNTIWAGYAASGARGDFNSVSASWTVPTVLQDCSASSTNSYSSFWVGLDGYGSNSVEQIGTDSDCKGGAPSYSAWYEMYPKRSVTLTSVSVQPGDTVSAHVSLLPGKGQFELYIKDTHSDGTTSVTSKTVDQHFAGAKLASAEVIAEAPSYNPGPFGAAPLTNFGTVYFTGALVNGDPIGSFSPLEEFQMVTPTGSPKATTSPLSSDTDFNVTWHAS